MERFHATVHHFGKSCYIGDVGDLKSGIAECLRCSARRYQFDSEICKTLCKLSRAGFIGEAYQCSFYSSKLGHKKRKSGRMRPLTKHTRSIFRQLKENAADNNTRGANV